MNLLVVVFAELLLFFPAPAAQWLRDVPLCVLAANHEANLSRGIGGDSGVAVLNDREDLFAALLELRDEGEVEPLVLSYNEGTACQQTWVTL